MAVKTAKSRRPDRSEQAETLKKARPEKEKYFDYSMLFIVIMLLGIGLVMIYSASSYTAFVDYNGDSLALVKKQAIAMGIGLVGMLFFAFFPYKVYEHTSLLFFLIAMGMVPLVLTKFGVESHGARRWIRLPGLPFNIQPAEVVKLTAIIFLAVFIATMGKTIDSLVGALVAFLCVVPAAVMVGVITNNLSSALILLGISFIMVFVASGDYTKYILIAVAGVIGAAVLVLVLVNGSGAKGFRGERILAWLDPETYAQGTGYQTLQALYAIASGGVFGKGLGESMQKLTYLPESQNDMIFAIICEELGFAGGIAIILLFIMLIWRMVIAANNAESQYAALLVVGVIAHISIQAILNIAVVTNTIPNTGVSLPFISYGGSAIMCLLCEVGLVLNVSRCSAKNVPKRRKKRDTEEA